MAVRRSWRALRAALACGVGALFRLAEAGVPRRIELSRSRVAERSRGVCTPRRDEGVVAPFRFVGVREGVLSADKPPLLALGVVSMMPMAQPRLGD